MSGWLVSLPWAPTLILLLLAVGAIGGILARIETAFLARKQRRRRRQYAELSVPSPRVNRAFLKTYQDSQGGVWTR